MPAQTPQKRFRLNATFEDLTELRRALRRVPPGQTPSDYIRVTAFKLPPLDRPRRETPAQRSVGARIRIAVTFTNAAELAAAKACVPRGQSYSDYIRGQGFGLPARNKSAGAPQRSTHPRAEYLRQKKAESRQRSAKPAARPGGEPQGKAKTGGGKKPARNRA